VACSRRAGTAGRPAGASTEELLSPISCPLPGGQHGRGVSLALGTGDGLSAAGCGSACELGSQPGSARRSSVAVSANL